MRIAQMIRVHRASFGILQKDLAAEIGIEPHALSRLEQGQLPDVSTYTKVAAWLFAKEETESAAVEPCLTDIRAPRGPVQVLSGGGVAQDAPRTLLGDVGQNTVAE